MAAVGPQTASLVRSHTTLQILQRGEDIVVGSDDSVQRPCPDD